MYGLLLVSIFSLCIALSVLYIEARRHDLISLVINPLFWYGVFYTLYCPIRGFLLSIQWADPFFNRNITESEYIIAEFYGTAYFLCTWLGYRFVTKILLPMHRSSATQTTHACHDYTSKQSRILITVLLLIAISSTIYGVVTGAYNVFKSSLYDQVFEIKTALIANGSAMGIYGFAIALFERKRGRLKWLAPVSVATSCLCLIAKGIAGGGRGNLSLALIVIFIYYVWTVGYKAGLYRVVLVLPALAVIGIAITKLREDTGSNIYRASDVISLSTIVDESNAVQSSTDKIQGISAIVTRATYYLDAWPVLASRSELDFAKTNKLFLAGSAGDLFQFVPALLWPGRPSDTFSLWMGRTIGGNYDLGSTLPVGGEGEGVYVFGWLGFIFGLIKGLMLGILAYFIQSNRISYAVSGLSILIVYVIMGDGTIFGSLVPAIKYVLWYVMISTVVTFAMMVTGHLEYNSNVAIIK